jgi:class 3 adenylate cyclase/CHASE2 domain-containing sensor protein
MKRRNSLLFLLTGVAAAIVFLYLPFAGYINHFGYDLFLSNTDAAPAGDDVVVVAIDNASLDEIEDPLVLWHEYLAGVIRGIADAGAKGVALDIIPSISMEKFAPGMDSELIRAIRYSGRRGTPVYLGFAAKKDGPVPHMKFSLAASGLGFLNLHPDEDGKVRRQRMYMSSDRGRRAYALSALLSGHDTEEGPEYIYIDYRLPMPEMISFKDVFHMAKQGDAGALPDSFRDKLVIIGVTSNKIPDIYSVPPGPEMGYGGRIPGVVIHAFSTKTIISGKVLKEVSSSTVWVMFFLAAFISGMLPLLLSPGRAGAVIAILFSASAAVSFNLFQNYTVMPFAPLVSGFVIPGFFTGVYRYTVQHRQFSYLQHFFKSYVNPHVMQEIIDNPKLVSFEGEETVATVMFTDIRSFSTLSENMEPSDVVAGLNKYFSEMTAAITGANGYLNKYLGDGILAVFGTPHRSEDNGAWDAVCCGIEMQRRLEKLNKSGIFPGVSEDVRIGIGVHTGKATVGNMGCFDKMDYSIIGDTVNLASRIESVTKEFGKPFLVSEETYERVKERVNAEFVTTTKVKGRAQDVRLYEIISIKEGAEA